MKRCLLFLCAPALALTACNVPEVSTGLPAPLEQTTIDDTALETADKAFDAALDAINLLYPPGSSMEGTAKGKAIASGIRRVNAALDAANAAVAAGSTTSYATALAEAKRAIDALRVTLRSN